MITRNWVFFGGSHVCFACALGFSSSLFRLLLSFLSGATCFFHFCSFCPLSVWKPGAFSHQPPRTPTILSTRNTRVPTSVRACLYIYFPLILFSTVCCLLLFLHSRKRIKYKPLVFIPSRKLSFFYLRIRKARYDFENTDCSAQQMCTNVDAQKK